jgi:hypothetical protein
MGTKACLFYSSQTLEVDASVVDPHSLWSAGSESMGGQKLPIKVDKKESVD